jgi:hypothetical protein
MAYYVVNAQRARNLRGVIHAAVVDYQVLYDIKSSHSARKIANRSLEYFGFVVAGDLNYQLHLVLFSTSRVK